MGNPARTEELRGIVEDLLAPLLKAKPDNINHHDWLDHCFATDRVEIRRWKVVERIDLPGRRQVFLDKYFKSTMKVRRSDVVFTREDISSNEDVVVELVRKGKLESKVYLVKKNDWIRLQVYLKPWPIPERDRPNNIDWSRVC